MTVCWYNWRIKKWGNYFTANFGYKMKVGIYILVKLMTTNTMFIFGVMVAG